MDAYISDGFYFPPSFTSGHLVEAPPAIIISAVDTSQDAVPPARVTKVDDTGIPPARVVKAEDTGPGAGIPPAVITNVEDTSPTIPPAEGEAADTGIPPARIVKVGDTGTP